MFLLVIFSLLKDSSSLFLVQRCFPNYPDSFLSILRIHSTITGFLQILIVIIECQLFIWIIFFVGFSNFAKDFYFLRIEIECLLQGLIDNSNSRFSP